MGPARRQHPRRRCLTSAPLVYGAGEHEEGRELMLSGTHRTGAAVEAGLDDETLRLLAEVNPEGIGR